ncbi:PKD domain-containing protein [Parapedobacter tibetensis]|uniref:PKD domain-containing protein n=1 Tax=Parapedobacter tibetensis TaxID=2972951 RepID=UPI00214D1786|nr:PKD domain-containing protein [Parapedobacter tibetensis]
MKLKKRMVRLRDIAHQAKHIWLVPAYLVLVVACKDDPLPVPDPEEPKPTALFQHEQIAADDPFSYAFTNNGTNFSLVRWEFGDDSVSLDDSPMHTFLRTGDYRVTMRTENSEGFWAESETMIEIRPDSIVEVATIPKPDGSLDLSVSSGMAIDSVFWYKGVGIGGDFLGNDELLNIAVESGQFEDYTLRVKTPNGSIAQISRLLTDLGIVRDMTNQGVFRVSRDNDGGQFAGEGSLKLIDNDTGTKFLQFNFAGDLWFELEYFEPIVLGGYTFTSANDASGRDPKNWRVEGSTDGENWVLLDERTDQVFDERFQTKTFTYENSTAYSFYRVSVTAVVSGGLFQMAEWQVLQMPQ